MAGNTFDQFSVFFAGDTVFLDGIVFPLGQLTTDVLNLDGKVLTEIDRRVNHFISIVWTLLQERTDSAARSAQERLNAEAYAEAYAAYFTDMAATGELFFPEQEFEQSFPAQLCFVPMAHPTEEGKILLTEKAEFRYLSHFLYTDFYRGLMAGNVPRRCHNCGRYFLLTNGYNTCYCNNVAPGETERTCRKVGAHRKANHPTGLSPAGVEYRKVYNRLKARKQRGKISKDEWNAALSQAQGVLDLAEQGKLTDEEMRNRFRTF